MSNPDISLVLPAYNEEVRLPDALNELSAFSRQSGLRLELVIADDGSDDATGDLIEKAIAAGVPGLDLKSVHISHRGKGAAVRAGMRKVTGPVVGYCDVDLSAGTDEIIRLLDRIKGHADVAIASRGLPGSVLEVRQPWYREAGGRLFNLLLRRLARVPYHDTQCGLKLFKRDVAQEVFKHQRLDGFAFDAELIVLATRLGYRVEEVPVRWAHSDGSKVSLVGDGFRMGRDILRIVRRLRTCAMHTLGVPSTAAIALMAASEDRHWWHVAKRKLVVREIGDQFEGMVCLDVGCGAGAMLANLRGSSTILGVDLSSQALSHARSRGLTSLVKGEAGALPLGSQKVDLAMALDVVEHHARPEDLLTEICRVLKPQGRLIVTVPAFQWMWSYADHVLGHYRRYTKARLASELVANGFEVTRVTYFHSWLLPVAWLFRRLRTVLRKTDRPDDFPLPGPLNRAFLSMSGVEIRYLQAHDLPFGLSVLAVARPSGSRVPSEQIAARQDEPAAATAGSQQ